MIAALVLCDRLDLYKPKLAAPGEADLKYELKQIKPFKSVCFLVVRYLFLASS